ncbi:MAG: DUF3137 domain-containing protein [Bacteroidales bacterium]|nr:DUF3137 domain-containing protein [Bacteroidales bacterium]
MKSLQEFESFYNQTLFREMEVLDARRKRVMSRLMSIIGFTATGMVLSILSAVYFVDPARDLHFVLIFAGPVVLLLLGLLFWGIWARDKNFVADFKKELIERIIHFISPDLSYQPANFIGVDSFERSRLFMTNIDRYNGDDYVFGKIDKTQFWFSEVKAEYKTTNSKGQTQWHTIFKGLFFVADFNKHFEGSTVVLPNRLGRGALARVLQKVNLSRREKLVKLEDPEFNKYFVVYGDDQIESRYVLSPSLMQRLTDFRKKHGSPLHISFVSSFLFLAIGYTKDLFEPSYFKSLTHFETVKPYFEDISLAVGIVEDLNLNTRIWTKQ